MSAPRKRAVDAAPIQPAGAVDEIEALRRSLRGAAERLRVGAEDEDRRAFALELQRLAAHPHPGVRQTVAEAADMIPADAFEALRTVLAQDADHFVRTAVSSVARQRATRKKARVRDVERETVASGLFAEIAKKGKATRRLAERAARRSTEYFVVKLHHEVTKIITPLDDSLRRLRAEVGRVDLNRGALTHEVGVALERATHLLAVLDSARAATATVVPRFGNEELLPLVREAGEALAIRLGPRAARLAVALDVPSTLRFDMHRSGLLQAFQNFFQNAAEAYPEDASQLDVRVSARTLAADAEVEVTVTDRGVGMSKEQQDDLFIPFGSRKPGGTGVGLIVARTMIEEVHGGTLSFESARGVGTTVKVVLPTRQSGRTHG